MIRLIKLKSLVTAFTAALILFALIVVLDVRESFRIKQYNKSEQKTDNYVDLMAILVDYESKLNYKSSVIAKTEIYGSNPTLAELLNWKLT